MGHKEGMEGWDLICGGLGGKEFEFSNQNYSLVGVQGNYNAMIEGLKFLFIDTHTRQFH